MPKNDLRTRLLADIADIRAKRERLDPKVKHIFRWEGLPHNPNGWRTLGDLANDIEQLLGETCVDSEGAKT